MSDFDSIFKKYYHALVLYAIKFVGDENIAADLVQDVFALVWEKRKLNMEQEHQKAYLFNATRNTCLNYLRHQKVVHDHQQQQISTLVDLELKHYESAEKSMIEKENLQKIQEAINSLSDIHREVIELSRFEGLKNKEIAQKLNIPLRTVETRLFRALASLRKKLSQKLIHIFFNFCQLKGEL
ncbi:RNA polymerase sigma-70 factor [Sunxiuqinia sp. A32]|uniref:RNA polymerase sigma-70 factor n=1 Tax=Sunxiuqinia sp. A32 TaxID=3461496 RepID=UPI00404665D9